MTVTIDTTDEAAELWANGRSGFDAVFRRHGRTVLRYALKLTGDASEAEELVQETFLSLWAKHRSIQTTGSSLLPWLLVTCRNHGANLVRAKQRRRQETAALVEAIERPAPAESTDWDWLRPAIEALPPRDRELVERCLIDGYSYREAADRLGMTVPAVAKRIERIRAALRVTRDS